MAPLLEITGLRSGYGSIEVLKGIDLYVNEGETVTVIGANGAGKTTLLMTISAILKARSGVIRFDGETINSSEAAIEAELIVKRGLIHIPEGRKIFPRMTIMENLEMGGYLRVIDKSYQADLDSVFDLFPVLKERLTQLGGTLSGGEQQMLAIGRAIMAKPRILLMDEPSLGLAPVIVSKIFEVIRRLKSRGVTILLVEQNARLALKNADRGYVLETGMVTLSDRAENLLKDERVKTAYLGM